MDDDEVDVRFLALVLQSDLRLTAGPERTARGANRVFAGFSGAGQMASSPCAPRRVLVLRLVATLMATIVGVAGVCVPHGLPPTVFWAVWLLFVVPGFVFGAVMVAGRLPGLRPPLASACRPRAPFGATSVPSG